MSVLVDEKLNEAVAYKKARRAFEDARRTRARARKIAQASGAPRNRGVEHNYCVARHKMMIAFQDFEWREEMAPTTALRVARYMNIARLPPELEFKDVLYYIDHCGSVHIFYGGQLSPLGDGNSPDGAGHGHVKLNPRKYGRSGYKLAYRRRPR